MKKVTVLYGLLLLCAAVSTAYGQDKIPLDPDVRTGKLPNGQTYYIRHNEIPKSRVDFYLVQKVGSVLEDENQRGLAHFLEHMAFNGSKHFPGNSLITELEKKGIKFGANINASTSYDETIYKLNNIPVRSGLTDTALLILHDWAGFLTLNDKEIDEERGVVREEWRLGAGGNLRVLQNDVFPVIYKGTPYANRLPIGSIDVVNNFKYQELRDYYKKWYRPDLQGIIVVGDIDVDAVEKKIKKIFADIPAPINPAPRPYVEIADNMKPIVAYGVDKEITAITFGILWKMDDVSPNQKSSAAWYKRNLIDQVIAAMLGGRFDELRDQPDAPFSYATVAASTYFVAGLKPAWNLNVGPKEKKDFLKGTAAVFSEIERMRRYGFTQMELDNAKENAFTGMKKQYDDRANSANSEFVNQYIKHFLAGDPAPGIIWEYEQGKKIMESLSLDTLNHYAQEAMGDKNLVIYGIAPESDFKMLPSEADILKVREQLSKMELLPYVYKKVDAPLLAKKPSGGRILKTEKKPFGFVQWTLSNGAKVWFRRTDYKEDKIQLRAWSPGGYAQLSDDDLPSGKMTGMTHYGGYGSFSMSELDKVLKGKDAWVNVGVEEFSKSMDGASSIKDIETLFQLSYLKMTAPRKDQQYFDAWKTASLESLKSVFAEPVTVFWDSVAMIMNNYNKRAIPVGHDSLLISKVNYDKAIDIYKSMFSNASDFTFFITGNISENQIKPLVETYFGGLPSVRKAKKPKNFKMYPPEGIITKRFTHPMTTPKSSIYVGYSGKNIPNNLTNQILMSYVGGILTLKYTENMREKEGGVYYVSSGGSISDMPAPSFIYRNQFSTDPDTAKKSKLMKIMYHEIEELMTKDPSAENINKVKGNLLKSMKEWSDLKTANYWNYTAWQYVMKGVDMQQYESIVQSITGPVIREFAKMIFNTGNRIELIMDPEKQ